MCATKKAESHRGKRRNFVNFFYFFVIFLQLFSIHLMYAPDSQSPSLAQPGQLLFKSSHLGLVGLGLSASQYSLLRPTMSEELKPFLWPSVAAPVLDLIVTLPDPKAVAS